MKIKYTPNKLITALVVVVLIAISMPTLIDHLSHRNVLAYIASGYFSPNTGTYNVGGEFVVSVHMDDGSSYDGASITFTVPSQLQLVGGTIDTGNTGIGSGSIVSQGDGQYEIKYSTGSPTTGDSTIASLTFKAISPGSAALVMDSVNEEISSSQSVALLPENASYTVNQPASTKPKPPPTSTGGSHTTTGSPSSKTSSTKSSSTSSNTPGSIFTQPSSTATTPSNTNTPITNNDLPSTNNPNINTPNSSTSSIGQSTPSPKVKQSTSNSGIVLLITLVISAAAALLASLLLTRHIHNGQEANRPDTDLLPLPSAPPSEVPYSLNETENDRINRGIERAFYPLRYRAEKAKRKDDTKS